ncbi:MAG: GHKL domain-containing protein [Eubacteriaceae bacterium]|nr:GHKL domain-containing protein [Eubacteriaceae bacterium]
MNLFDNLILIFSCIAELYVCHYFTAAFFEKRIENKTLQTGVFLFLCSAIYFINLIGSANINLIFAPSVLLIYIFCAFRVKLLQGIMHYIIILTSSIGSEFVFVVIANVTLDDSAVNLSRIPGLTFAVKLMSFLILTLIKQFSGRNKKRLINSVFWMYVCLPVSSLSTMFITFFALEDMLENPNTVFALSAGFGFVLLGNIIVFNAFNRYSEELHASVEKEWLITKEQMNHQYYEKVVEMNEKRKIMIHDLRHYTGALKALIQTGDNEEAIRVLQSFNGELDKNEKSVYSTIPFLDIVLSEKHSYAETLNVKCFIDVSPDVKLGKINKVDYAVMLGNLLDNAIEAAGRSHLPGTVSVRIFMRNNNSFLTSKISNTFNPDCIRKTGDGFASSKSDKDGLHGTGLKSVKATCENNGGFFYTTIEEDLFAAVLVLPIK